jgi:PHD/YefM family antitoxin component YafN of YafNO toxin-antitoxin module
VRQTRQPLVITQNGKATAVLQDVETYQEQRQALLLVKFLARGDQELKQGKAISHSQARQHSHDTILRLKRG